MRYVGVDLHKNKFTAYFADTVRYRDYGTNSVGIMSFIHDCKRSDDCKGVMVGVESTGNTRYFKRMLEAEGIQVKVINTMKFKVIAESVTKTDKHDAATIAEFLEKDMIPEVRLCSDYSEQLRRLLKVRKTLVETIVTIKNQIHGILAAYGYEDTRASLQSKRGRQRILSTLASTENGLVVQPLIQIIDELDEKVKHIEKIIEEFTKHDNQKRLLQTIPGCGDIIATTILAYTDDIRRFKSPKQYAAYAGLVPYVHNSNTMQRHRTITKHGPEPLRTAFVQLVLGTNRVPATRNYRIMKQYRALKQHKGSGKAIIAIARKYAEIVWHMLTYNEPFCPDKQLQIPCECNRSIQVYEQQPA